MSTEKAKFYLSTKQTLKIGEGTMKTSSEVEFGMEKINTLVKQAENNPEICDRIIENPLQELESLGIVVEDQFQEAVVSELKSKFQYLKHKGALEATPQKAKMEDIKPPTAPTGLHVTEKSKSDVISVKSDSAVVKKDKKLPSIHFYCNVWGTVLRLDEEGLKLWKLGKGIEAAVSGTISAGSGLASGTGVAVPLAAITGIYTACIVAQLAVAEAINEGKGVYLTTTWAHYFFPIPGIIQFPIITPIK